MIRGPGALTERRAYPGIARALMKTGFFSNDILIFLY
jgi:hypothetical protein